MRIYIVAEELYSDRPFYEGDCLTEALAVFFERLQYTTRVCIRVEER